MKRKHREAANLQSDMPTSSRSTKERSFYGSKSDSSPYMYQKELHLSAQSQKKVTFDSSGSMNEAQLPNADLRRKHKNAISSALAKQTVTTLTAVQVPVKHKPTVRAGSGKPEMPSFHPLTNFAKNPSKDVITKQETSPVNQATVLGAGHSNNPRKINKSKSTSSQVKVVDFNNSASLNNQRRNEVTTSPVRKPNVEELIGPMEQAKTEASEQGTKVDGSNSFGINESAKPDLICDRNGVKSYTKTIVINDQAAETESADRDAEKLPTLAVNSNFSMRGHERFDIEQSAANKNTVNLPSAMPKWFPLKVQKILESPNFPHATIPTEINKLNHYRAWLEGVRFRRWQRFNLAETKRTRLTELLLRYKKEGRSMEVYTHRFAQRVMWKREALKAFKRMEKLAEGVKILEIAVNNVFEHKRAITKEWLRIQKRAQRVRGMPVP